jgi:hypothetical protein
LQDSLFVTAARSVQLREVPPVAKHVRATILVSGFILDSNHKGKKTDETTQIAKDQEKDKNTTKEEESKDKLKESETKDVTRTVWMAQVSPSFPPSYPPYAVLFSEQTDVGGYLPTKIVNWSAGSQVYKAGVFNDKKDFLRENINKYTALLAEAEKKFLRNPLDVSSESASSS